MWMLITVKDTVDINVPNGSVVASEGTQSLSIQRVPDIRLRIFSTWKYQISLPVVFDLSDGPFMSMKQYRFLK